MYTNNVLGLRYFHGSFIMFAAHFPTLCYFICLLIQRLFTICYYGTIVESVLRQGDNTEKGVNKKGFTGHAEYFLHFV